MARIKYSNLWCLFSVWLSASRDWGPFLRRIDTDIKWSLAFHLGNFFCLLLTQYLRVKPSLRPFLCDRLPAQGLSPQFIGGVGLSALLALSFAVGTQELTWRGLSVWFFFFNELPALCRHSHECLQEIALLRWSSQLSTACVFFKSNSWN